MAIFLNTGAPGAGKSLYTLWEVENRRRKENREVFYSGIADLLLPWTLFGDSTDAQRPHMTNPERWPELPTGAIIVIDEAQRLFRPRALTKDVPAYVAALETHRHTGHDLYIITQHPMLIETNVRKLVEAHRHIMRKFGTSWVTIHEWKGVKENCDKSRKDSQPTEFKYPKEIFTWYKSAEVHTHKVRVPKKVIMLVTLPFVLVGAAWYAWNSLQKVHTSGVGGTSAAAKAAPGQVVPGQVAGGSPGGGGGNYMQRNVPLSQRAYTSQFQPRFSGLAWTAPRYDALTFPTRAPVPVGCVLYEGDAVSSYCITQQGTRFSPPLQFIRDFVQKGMFVDFGGAAPGTPPQVQTGSPAAAPGR